MVLINTPLVSTNSNSNENRPMYKRSFFHRSTSQPVAFRVIGSDRINFEWRSGIGSVPPSETYVCRQCGEIYFSINVTEETTLKLSKFMFYLGTCSLCPPDTRDMLISIPGSIWRGYDDRFTNSLPRSVLLYELELHNIYCKVDETISILEEAFA